jgi:hypothetical protein
MWVYADARSLEDRKQPVVLSTAWFTIDRPERWAVLCFIAVYFFFPPYTVARGHG